MQRAWDLGRRIFLCALLALCACLLLLTLLAPAAWQ